MRNGQDLKEERRKNNTLTVVLERTQLKLFSISLTPRTPRSAEIHQISYLAMQLPLFHLQTVFLLHALLLEIFVHEGVGGGAGVGEGVTGADVTGTGVGAGVTGGVGDPPPPPSSVS